MRKYYDKTTVIYKFKLNILVLPENQGVGQSRKEELWSLYLYALSCSRKITAKNAQTWKYPTKELK